mmetsp:Transcript_87566/g.256028  ORF Transcript_87566/g.256028 Transcript_87566/m.256028 type:complete len:267 (-) Transcript_87566:6-806(-)
MSSDLTAWDSGPPSGSSHFTSNVPSPLSFSTAPGYHSSSSGYAASTMSPTSNGPVFASDLGIFELCTKPSLSAPMSTNAPNSRTFWTVPLTLLPICRSSNAILGTIFFISSDLQGETSGPPSASSQRTSYVPSPLSFSIVPGYHSPSSGKTASTVSPTWYSVVSGPSCATATLPPLVPRRAPPSLPEAAQLAAGLRRAVGAKKQTLPEYVDRLRSNPSNPNSPWARRATGRALVLPWPNSTAGAPVTSAINTVAGQHKNEFRSKIA